MQLQRVLVLFCLGAMACANQDPVGTCHYASGRPCAPGHACFDPQGEECNTSFCASDHSFASSALECKGTPPHSPQATGGPFDCDVTLVRTGIPAQGPCPLGQLHAIVSTPGFGLFYGACVSVADCKPLPCDPSFGNEGCPTGYGCSDTSTCTKL